MSSLQFTSCASSVVLLLPVSTVGTKEEGAAAAALIRPAPGPGGLAAARPGEDPARGGKRQRLPLRFALGQRGPPGEDPQPGTVRRSDLPGATAAGADPQRLGPVASLPRVLERIQHGEGRGKGRRCAPPWANVGRLERIRSRARSPGFFYFLRVKCRFASSCV